MTTPAAEAKVAAWFACWRCGCAEARPSAQVIPNRCPGHDAERILDVEQVDVPAENADAHLCGEQPWQTPCPEREAAA